MIFKYLIILLFLYKLLISNNKKDLYNILFIIINYLIFREFLFYLFKKNKKIIEGANGGGSLQEKLEKFREIIRKKLNDSILDEIAGMIAFVTIFIREISNLYNYSGSDYGTQLKDSRRKFLSGLDDLDLYHINRKW